MKSKNNRYNVFKLNYLLFYRSGTQSALLCCNLVMTNDLIPN